VEERGRAEGPRDSSKGQMAGQGRSERDADRDNARHSQDSSKEQRDTSKDRAQQHGQKDKDHTVGQNKSERDNTQRSEDRTQDKGKATKVDSKSNNLQSGSGTQGQSAQDRNSNSGTNQIAGPETREAITVYQRQQGIAVTGSVDMRTVSSLGVSSRLSQQASQRLPGPSCNRARARSCSPMTSSRQCGKGKRGRISPDRCR
jgi:hypothetical protein